MNSIARESEHPSGHLTKRNNVSIRRDSRTARSLRPLTWLPYPFDVCVCVCRNKSLPTHNLIRINTVNRVSVGPSDEYRREFY